MLKIDDNLLQEIGLGTLPTEEKRSLLAHIYETLEMRVGMRLADQMTNEQLDEFEMYFEAKDDAGAFKWLESNFPNYKDIVNDEFGKLKGEVQQSAPQILSASQANPLSAQAPAPGGNPAMMPPQPAPQQPWPQQPSPPQQQTYQPQPPQYQHPQPTQYAPPQQTQAYPQPADTAALQQPPAYSPNPDLAQTQPWPAPQPAPRQWQPPQTGDDVQQAQPPQAA